MADRIFIEVPILLTENEYAAFRKNAALTAEGTTREAIRQALGKPFRPFGIGPAHAPTEGNLILTEDEYLDRIEP
jgi:hypothetical protein